MTMQERTRTLRIDFDLAWNCGENPWSEKVGEWEGRKTKRWKEGGRNSVNPGEIKMVEGGGGFYVIEHGRNSYLLVFFGVFRLGEGCVR